MEGVIRNCPVSGLEVLFNETGSECTKAAWIKAEVCSKTCSLCSQEGELNKF